VSAIDNAVDRLEREVDLLKDAVRGLRQGVDRDQEDLASLQKDLKDVRQLAQDTTTIERIEAQILSSTSVIHKVKQGLGDASSQIRSELSVMKSELQQLRSDVELLKPEAKGTRAIVDEQAREMTALRGRIAQLRRESEQGRLGQSAIINAPFPSRELDILTSSIAKIGNRASQVETLQMEFAILKGRVERVESRNAAAGSQGVQLQSDLLSVPTVVDRREESRGVLNPPQTMIPPRIASPGLSTSPTEMPNTKRPAASSDGTDAPTREQIHLARWLDPSQPPPTIADAGPRKKRAGIRSTRRGTEKRTTRRVAARPG